MAILAQATHKTILFCLSWLAIQFGRPVVRPRSGLAAGISCRENSEIGSAATSDGPAALARRRGYSPHRLPTSVETDLPRLWRTRAVGASVVRTACYSTGRRGRCSERKHVQRNDLRIAVRPRSTLGTLSHQKCAVHLDTIIHDSMIGQLWIVILLSWREVFDGARHPDMLNDMSLSPANVHICVSRFRFTC